MLIWLGKVQGQSLAPHIHCAEKSLWLGIEISKELSQRPDEAVGYLFLAELYANQDREGLALEYLNKSFELFEEMKMKYWPGKAQEMLTKLGHE